MSISLSHTCGPAAVLQGLITLRDAISKYPLGLLNNHLHLCGTWSQAWYGHFLISSSLKFRTVSTVSIFLFFFPSYHHHPCFMEIERSKRSNRSQSECSKQLPWEVTPCPIPLPISCAFWHVQPLLASSPAPGTSAPWLPVGQERGTSFLAGALAFATAPGGVSGPLQIFHGGTLGSVWIL